MAGVVLGTAAIFGWRTLGPQEAGPLQSEPAAPIDAPLVLSALDATVARDCEPALVRAGHVVVTNASPHRMDADVPLLVPEVNDEHLGLVEAQSYDGALITNPNCSTIGLTLALGPSNPLSTSTAQVLLK